MTVFEFPASFAQRRLWLLDQIDPGQPTYNIAWALWLDGSLDPTALELAWNAALVRHEALRTTFRNEAGRPVQVIDDDPPAARLEVIEPQRSSGAARDTAAATLLREWARTPFDLNKPPLARSYLLRLSAQRHIFAVVAHHIVADGWSFRLLFDEIAADYEAALGSQPFGSAEPPIQYADFALWQIEHADAGEYAAAERFWRRELAGASLALPLPADRPYPPQQTFAAAAVNLRVPDASTAALRRFAASRGVTLFAVLLAAYAALLSRLTGCADLLVGVPVAARTRPETEPVVGLFMNTIAVRVRLFDQPTLAHLVEQVHASTAAALTHQDLPFARVVDLLRPERDPARGPLVQAMFALDEPFVIAPRGGLRWSPEIVENGTVKVELELVMVDGSAGLGGRLRYNEDLFTAASGARFAHGVIRMLDAMARDPGTRVCDVDILDPETRERVTRIWARGPDLAPGEPTATALVLSACTGERVVARDGEAIVAGSDAAAADDATAMTADRARTRARQIAAGLRDLGVKCQDHVGVLLPRGPGLIPALLGVWWLGAAYVPLDATYPPERLRAMVTDAGVRAVITDGGSGEPVPSSLAAIGVAVPVLDVTRLTAMGPGPGEPLDVPSTATAYTIFTSGSTGRPKAVSISHGSLAAMLRAFAAAMPLGPSDRWVAVTTLAFDISALELFLPLLQTAQVIIASTDQATDGSRLRHLLERANATALQATPATWRMLQEAGGVPGGVRLRLCGGEALPRDLASDLAAGDAGLWNVYGPTETTVWSTAGRVSAGDPADVGPAIAGTQIYILDDWMRPVPPGVVGEVHLGGAGVGRGYVGAPALTAQRFLPDPYCEDPGARLYRTGDLGRWRDTGRIDLVGRRDRQVKVRGFRIETGEIEAVMRAHADIADAAVALKHGRAGGEDARLVAYIVARTGAAAAPAALREHLRRFLPDYMLPATFVALAALPRTPSGKLDHRALPDPQWDAASTEPTTPPRTPVERELAQLFADLLDLSEPVGVHDNFFILGGHSLTATRLMARVRDRFGLDLPVRILFSNPSVSGLALAIADADTTVGQTETDIDEMLRSLMGDERR